MVEQIQKLKPGYKQTELGVLPKSWEVLPIEELITRDFIEKPLDGNHGEIHPKSNDFVEDGIPFIMANNIHEDSIDLTKCHFISKEQADSLQKGFSITGDVLLTHKGTVGNVAIVGKINTEYIMLTPQVTYYRVKNSNAIYNQYIKQFFQAQVFQEILKNISGGGTRAYIGITSQRKLPFILPPIEEQKAIVQILSGIDALIKHLKKLIIKNKNLKQGAMQKLLNPKDNWEKKKLTGVVNYIHGKAHERDIVEDGKYSVVNSKFISTEGLVVKFSNMNYCPAKKGDVLTVLSDLPNGKALAKCYLVDADNKYAVNQRICIWRTKGADSRFLFYLLNRNKYFLGFDDGVSQTHILNNHIQKCEILIPTSKIEQENIGKILSDMDIEIKKLEQKKDKYTMLKQGMMQELLTGRIRINVD